MSHDAVQIIARGPRALAESAAEALDAHHGLEAVTYSILEEDEDRDVWRIDAFPTEPAEADTLRQVLEGHGGLVVSTEVLAANPNLGKALAGIWYETMTLMSADTPEGAAAREAMAQISGTDLAGYEAQLATTFMYYTPQDALAAMLGEDIVAANDKVRQFSFQAGLFGQGARSVDDIGISFPGDKILGNPENVMLRFDPTYTQMAADGAL